MGPRDCPWQKSNSQRVKLLGPVCVGYGHPDLERTHKYLDDFGMVKSFEREEAGAKTVYYRGYGVQPVIYIAKQTPKPEFFGVFFEAASETDLGNATKIPGASKIREFVEGGRVVDITDPSGMPFHVVFGMKKREFTPRENEVEPQNYPAPTDTDAAAKPRRGKFHRLTRGAIPIHKLGHCGYVPKDINATCDFYCENFNFKPSDVLLDPNGEIMIIFMHVDLGKDYSDHHSFFLAQPFGPSVPGTTHHAAFEVESIDTQFVGHEYLQSKGYQAFWGVGRHIEGSQVFDYWFDLDGFLVEHYTDGDIVNEEHPITYVENRDLNSGSNWGPGPLMPKQGIPRQEKTIM
jgi:Glyoxalase/Bleomycin resistance protein/Dioxygenase superfamily